MSSDIVERLRATYTVWNNPPSPELPEGAGVMLEAAAEIERLRGQEAANKLNAAQVVALRAEIERLRAALVGARLALSQGAVASCECLTKTPDPEVHAVNCRYRILMLGERAVSAALGEQEVRDEN